MSHTKKHISGVDLMIDDDTGALLIEPAGGFRAISPPAAVTAIAAQWTAIELPEGVRYVHVGVSEETYLVAKVTAGDPANVGCAYAAAGNHEIDCYGCTKLYAKPTGASNSTVSWTPFGWVAS